MKKYKLTFSPSAIADLKDATKWYNSQQAGLGKKFKEEIKKTTDSILSNPRFASIKYESVRTVACKIFPYSIHFEIDEDARIVRIISIFHFSRKPGWLKD